MVGRQAPIDRWGVHLSAGLIGISLMGALELAPPLRPPLRWMLAVAGWLAVASTLLAPGIEGMQRWHELGPLRLHPSALLTPALLIFAASSATHRAAAHALLLVLQAVHLAQPDAGQATALGCGALALLLVDTRQRSKLPLATLYVASIIVGWLRPDPLPPAAFVEDILKQAFALGVLVGFAALLSLALLLISPFAGEPARRRSPATSALFAYFLGALFAPVFGEYPVPLLGFGTSPVIGAFLGLAALNRLRSSLAQRRSDTATHHVDSPADDDRQACGRALPSR